MSISFLSLFFFTIFLIPNFSQDQVLAQTGGQASISYQCTSALRCSTEPENQHCQPFDDDVHESKKWEHRVQIDLSTLTFPANTDIYITECLAMGEDLNGDGQAEPVCTTGDATLDKTLFCGDPNDTRESCNHLKILERKKYSLTKKESYGIFHFVDNKYVPAPNLVIQSDANGKSLIPKIEWQSYTEGMIHRHYQAWFKTPEPTPTPTASISGVPSVSPAVGGQQQNILTFPAGQIPAEIPPPQNCEGVTWDPYGFVFDMKSLEPVPNVEVLLSMKKPDGAFDAAFAVNENFLIANPFTTEETGQFTFFVKDGDYMLTPKAAGYMHPTANQYQLSANSTKIYSTSIYYSDSLPIQQRGSIQRRDIPLWPSDGVGKTYDLKVLMELSELTPDGRMTYSGRVSHPYAELVFEVCKKTNGVETCKEPVVYNQLNGGPNKLGNFSITVDQKLLLTGEYYNRSFRKTDLTKLNLSKSSLLEHIYNRLLSLTFPKGVYAMESTTKASINPIITYLEGFAYDTEGILLPNTEVQILVPLSETPVYKVTANAQGYFKITSEFLPKTGYSIKYVPLGVSSKSGSKITTSQFLTQNQEFIELEQINPYLVTTQARDPRKDIIPTYVPPAKIPSLTKEFQEPVTVNPTQTVNQSATTSNNNMFLIGAIILLIVATVGVGAGIYLYKKRMQPPSQE